MLVLMVLVHRQTLRVLLVRGILCIEVSFAVKVVWRMQWPRCDLLVTTRKLGRVWPIRS